MTYAHHFINISQNILNPETRHLRLQFEYKNEAIPIIIESDIISPKGKMRSRFMILYQPSLNDLPFIFPPPLLYKPSLSFILKHRQKPLLFSSLEFQEVEQSYHVLVFLRLKVLSETHFFSPNSSFPPPLEPPSKVSFSTIWILHKSIILFPNCFCCCHDESLRLKLDNNHLNSFEYV